MADVTFPSSLPPPEARYYTYELDMGLRRTDMGSGNARQRRKFNNLPQTYRLSWLVSREQKVLLMWFLDRFANEYFNTDLVTPDATTTLTTAEVRLRSNVTETYFSSQFFRVSAVFEAINVTIPDPDELSDFLLMESGDSLLKEDGGKIYLETSNIFIST